MQKYIAFCALMGLFSGIYQMYKARVNPIIIEEEPRVKSFFDV